MLQNYCCFCLCIIGQQSKLAWKKHPPSPHWSCCWTLQLLLLLKVPPHWEISLLEFPFWGHLPNLSRGHAYAQLLPDRWSHWELGEVRGRHGWYWASVCPSAEQRVCRGTVQLARERVWEQDGGERRRSTNPQPRESRCWHYPVCAELSGAQGNQHVWKLIANYWMS